MLGIAVMVEACACKLEAIALARPQHYLIDHRVGEHGRLRRHPRVRIPLEERLDVGGAHIVRDGRLEGG